MEFLSFRVKNFRSVNDSGEVRVGKLTALVGRNESGKSNLLLALLSLNPPGGPHDLSPIKDFPRHRRLSECHEDTPVVSTRWRLDATERAELAGLFPRAADVSEVAVGRLYKAPTRWVGFVDLPPLRFSPRDVAASVRRIKPAVLAAAGRLEGAPRVALEEAAAGFDTALTAARAAEAWAPPAAAACAALRLALANAALALPEREDELLAALEAQAEEIRGDEAAHQHARSWVVGRLPAFVYVEEYPDLAGHQDVVEYLGRKNQRRVTAADRHFERLCELAGLSPEELFRLQLQDDHETRSQLANRAGAVVTAEIRRLWHDRALKVRFNLDAQHLDTLVSDPNAAYDVEVNLDERSRGFKWFFSFYVAFAAGTRDGPAGRAVLLLDEPGLHLHATSQADLLRHLAADLPNPVLYTTHSPFMVPDDLTAVRTVSIAEAAGTTVSNEPVGDARTLFPLRAALGYRLTEHLFGESAGLVVGELSDYWILSAASEYLESVGRTGLPPGVTITPAGGAREVAYMAALLASQGLHTLVLRGVEGPGVTGAGVNGAGGAGVVESPDKAARAITVGGVLAPGTATAAGVEDLLDAEVYASLVRESYKAELRGRKLSPHPAGLPIARRYAQAFAGAGLDFHPTRPARLLLRRMAAEPEAVMTPTACERFEALFRAVAARLPGGGEGSHLNTAVTRRGVHTSNQELPPGSTPTTRRPRRVPRKPRMEV